MARIQDIDIPYLEFAEAVAPGTPAAGIVRQYAKTDGLLYSKDDAGTETLMSGGAGGGGAGEGCKVYNAGVQSISHNTVTAITFGAEEHDTDAYHDTGSNTSRITIPTGLGGLYLLTAGGLWASGHASQEQLFRVDGTTNVRSAVGNGGTSLFTNLTAVVQLTQGQYVEFIVYQASGGSINFGHATSLDAEAHFSATRLRA